MVYAIAAIRQFQYLTLCRVKQICCRNLNHAQNAHLALATLTQSSYTPPVWDSFLSRSDLLRIRIFLFSSVGARRAAENKRNGGLSLAGTAVDPEEDTER